jgi:hypothetical protein
MAVLKDILKERGNRYGEFKDNSEVSQGLKDIIDFALHAFEKSLPAYQHEALTVICQKISRIVVGDSNYSDSWIDIAGYATLVVKELDKDSILRSELQSDGELYNDI